MKIEAFVLCDAATDYRGKLNILGTFDTISAAEMPVVWPHCALALRIRFSKIEEGAHRVRISFIDDDGHAVLPLLEGEMKVKFGPASSTTAANLILNMDRLKLDRAGEYSIHLAVDGRQEMSLPLYIKLREGKAASPPRFD